VCSLREAASPSRWGFSGAARSGDLAPNHLVFPRPDGTPWSDHDWRNWRRRVFRGVAQGAGVGHIRPYDLRHLFVSLLLSEGRSIVDVAAQAGHAPSLSYDTYGHVLYDLEPTENRPAEAVIDAARTAGVPTVFPPPGRLTTEEALESAHLQAKH
jgi:integrase